MLKFKFSAAAAILAACSFCALNGAEVQVQVDPMAINRDPSFEQKNGGWNQEAWLNPEYSILPKIDTKEVVHGKQSLRFDAISGKSIRVIQYFLHSGLINGKAVAFRLSGWIKKADLNGVYPVLQVEALITKGKTTTKYFNAKATGKTFNGFSEYAADIPAEEGILRFAVAITAPKSSADASGSFYVDNVSLVPVLEADRPVIGRMVPGGDNGIYVEGEKIKVSSVVCNTAEKAIDATLKVDIFDHKKKIVASQKITCSLNGKESKEIVFEPEISNCGFYYVQSELQKGNSAPFRADTAFVITARSNERDPFFGVTGYGMPNCLLNSVKKLGIGSVGYVLYPNVQSAPGVFNFSRYDHDLKVRKEMGFNIIAGWNIQGANHLRPGWVNKIAARDFAGKGKNYSEEYFKSYRDLARAAALYFKDKTEEISLIEEIDIAKDLNKFEHDSYIRIVRESAQEIKKAVPSMRVRSIGVASPDFNANPPLVSMKHFWNKLNPYIDGIGFDGYILPNTYGEGRMLGIPENNRYREKLLEVARITRQAGKRDFAMDEAGWCMVSTTPLNSDIALKLSAVLQRTMIISKSVPEMKYYLYFKVLDGTRAEDWNLFNRFGTVPNAAAAGYGVVSHNLAFARDAEELKLHNDLYAYIFEQKGKTLLTIWSIADNNINFSIDVPENAAMSDFMGRRSILKKGRNQLVLNDEPIYIWFNSDRATVKNMLKNAKFAMPSFKVDMLRAGNNSAMLIAKNLTDTSLTADFSSGKTKEKVSFKAYETKNFLLNNIDCNAKDTVVNVRVNGMDFKFRKNLQATEIGQKDFSVIKLDSPGTLFPVDALANSMWTNPEDLSATVKMKATPQYLHVICDVTDDVRIRTREGSRLWGNDAIQFAINPKGNAPDPAVAGKPGYGTNDWEFGMAKTPKGPQLFCYIAPGRTKMSGKLVSASQIPFSVTDISGNVTRYEVKLPWKLLNLEPETGTVFGFNLIALDTDRKDITSSYWMQMSSGITNGKRPDLFRKFILK